MIVFTITEESTSCSFCLCKKRTCKNKNVIIENCVVCVCVCVREREREREKRTAVIIRGKGSQKFWFFFVVYGHLEVFVILNTYVSVRLFMFDMFVSV